MRKEFEELVSIFFFEIKVGEEPNNQRREGLKERTKERALLWNSCELNQTAIGWINPCRDMQILFRREFVYFNSSIIRKDNWFANLNSRSKKKKEKNRWMSGWSFFERIPLFQRAESSAEPKIFFSRQFSLKCVPYWRRSLIFRFLKNDFWISLACKTLSVGDLNSSGIQLPPVS